MILLSSALPWHPTSPQWRVCAGKALASWYAKHRAHLPPNSGLAGCSFIIFVLLQERFWIPCVLPCCEGVLSWALCPCCASAPVISRESPGWNKASFGWSRANQCVYLRTPTMLLLWEFDESFESILKKMLWSNSFWRSSDSKNKSD